MSVTNMTRLLALLVLLAMVAAACGQKEGVHVGFAGGGGVGAGATEGFLDDGFVDADGDGIDDSTNLSQEEFTAQFGGTSGGTDVAAGGGGDTSGATGGGGDTSGATGGAQTAGTTSGGGGGSSGGSGGGGSGGGSGGGGSGGGGGGDSTGVTANTITIGVHAPLTGAAPLPASSFQEGKDQYWKAGNKVAGRTVKVVFRDDKYNPSTASQVCQEMIHQEKVFLLIGAAGTDQIAQCARVAASAGVPYLSAGVTEIGLDKLSNYFALSFTYSQQMPLLMQMIKKQQPPGNRPIGLVASNTPNFDDAVAAYQKAAKSAGFKFKVYRPDKQPSDGQLSALAGQMASDNVKVATPVIAPTQWIKLASNPQVRAVGMEWHGIGVTQGVNQAGDAACKFSQGAVNGSSFFSPWPGLNLAKDMDPNFRKAGGEDDIMWSFWGLNKALHAAFSKMGNTLTRQAFVQAMTGSVKGGIYPETRHTSSNHFGATSTHVLRLECSGSGGTYKSGSGDLFKKGF